MNRFLSTRRAARAALITVCAAAVAAGAAPGRTGAQTQRRLSAGFSPVFYIFDDSYWGIGQGYGADIVLRCEIFNNLFVENRLGGYGAAQGDAGITGFNGQVGIIHFLPYWIPYRPSLRAAFAFMTVNPVISEPVETFRPSQTILYFVAGGGISWSLKKHLQLELGADLLVTPYLYRVYEFHRQYVEGAEERFLHGAFTVSATYLF